jgi:hypothetical protein
MHTNNQNKYTFEAIVMNWKQGLAIKGGLWTGFTMTSGFIGVHSIKLSPQTGHPHLPLSIDF